MKFSLPKKTGHKVLAFLTFLGIMWFVFVLVYYKTQDTYYTMVGWLQNLDESLTDLISRILKRQRKHIFGDLFELNNDRNNLSESLRRVQSLLSQRVLELGGNPLRNMIVSTWRCGSTFLAESVHHHPGNFYHYEPLLPFGIHRIRPDENSTAEAVRLLNSLFQCRYVNLEEYMKFGKQYPFLFSHNVPLWLLCQNTTLCQYHSFLEAFCSLFPYQTMKTVRLHLNLTQQLLENRSLNLRVLYLVRDPRGTLESRKHRVWCPSEPDCIKPEILCSDLVEEYYIARYLLYRFPEHFRVVRYEDFSSKIYQATKDIYQFFQLTYTKQTELFLKTHTQSDWGGVSSTYRHSKSAPFNWRLKLEEDEVLSIEKHCQKALRLWGYNEYGSNQEVNLMNFKSLNTHWTIFAGNE